MCSCHPVDLAQTLETVVNSTTFQLPAVFGWAYNCLDGQDPQGVYLAMLPAINRR